MLLDNTIQNLKRGREIIRILLKYGFEDIVINTPLYRLIPKSRRLNWVRQDRPVLEFTRFERIRMVAEELGPTYVKFAQVLSNRPDILPGGLITEFEKLQSDVPPFDSAIAREILERETGRRIADLFESFEDKPIGSASIGQVHKAVLKTGEEVVVKIQRPKIRRVIESDLAIMKEVVRRTEQYFESQGLINLMDVILAFEKTMQKELDYNNEARNIEQFREFYKKEKSFYVPKAYKDLCSRKVLVIEFIEAVKITNLAKLTEWNLDPPKLAEQGIDIYLKQIFEFGYFHADPHPGNILVKQDGTICLIDFGMVGKLMQKDKFAFAGVFIGIAQHDARKMAYNLRKLALDDEVKDDRSLEYDLNEIVEDFSMLDVSESSMADLAVRLQKIIYNYKMRIPGSIFLILRAFSLLEGIGKVIHPNFKTYDFIKPYGRKIIQDQFSPANIWDELLFRITQFDYLIRNFPIEVNQILRTIRKGRLNIKVENEGYEPMVKKADSVINRLNMTLIIVAFLIGSSIIMTADLGDAIKTSNGVPYLSIVGFVLAGMFGLVLLIRTLRNW